MKRLIGLLLVLALLIISNARAQITGGGGVPQPVVNGSCLVGSGGVAVWASCSGTGSGVNWPATNDLLVSNGTDTPAGLAPVTSALIYGGVGGWAALATGNNGVLVTSGAGVPSISSTLPSGLTIPGYLTANQTITLSGAISGTGTTAITTTCTQFSSSVGGCVPASGGGTTNFMRADGTWATPPGGGGGVTWPTLGDLVVSPGGSGNPTGLAPANNDLIYGTGGAWAALASANSGVLVTSGAGVPSISTTLPNALALGTPASETLTNATGLPVGGIAAIGNNTVVGNVSGSSASPAALTATQLTTLCNAFTTALSGCAPASGGGTTNYMRADGTWAAPPGTGSGITWPTTGDLVVSNSTNSPAGLAPVNNDLVYGTGGAWAALSSANSGVLVTSGAGVPSVSTTLPDGLALGTPSSETLTNATGLPAAGIAAIGNNTVVGNVSGSSASPTALSATQLTTLCNDFTSSLSGCAPASGGGTTNFMRADGTWAAPPSSSSTPIIFTGAATFSSNAYTVSTTIPVTGFSFVNGYAVWAYITAANTASATLAVDGTTAETIEVQTSGGAPTALAPSQLNPGTGGSGNWYEFIADTTCTCYLLATPPPSIVTIGAATQNVPASTMTNWGFDLITAASQTLTLPSTASANGGLFVASQGSGTGTLAAAGGNTLNGAAAVNSNALCAIVSNGSTSDYATCVSGNVNIGTTGQLANYAAGGQTLSGTSNPNLPSGGSYQINSVKLPTTVVASAGWVAGVNPNGASIVADLTVAHTLASIVFREEIALGATGTVAVYIAASGTACGSGTNVASNTFNANGTAATNQSLTLTTTAVPAGDSICIQTTGGASWGSGASIGTVSVYMNPT